MCVIIFINLKRNIIYITCISVLSRHVATFLKVEGEGGADLSKKWQEDKQKKKTKTKTETKQKQQLQKP